MVKFKQFSHLKKLGTLNIRLGTLERNELLQSKKDIIDHLTKKECCKKNPIGLKLILIGRWSTYSPL